MSGTKTTERKERRDGQYTMCFKGIVKALKDNVADVALKTHSLLLGIRTLAEKTRIRFISGRPRKKRFENPAQLLFDLS